MVLLYKTKGSKDTTGVNDKRQDYILMSTMTLVQLYYIWDLVISFKYLLGGRVIQLTRRFVQLAMLY
jgi:uncharacterized membrane protein (DUF485 family)